MPQKSRMPSKEILARCYADGMSVLAMAKKFDYSESHMYQVLKKHGLRSVGTRAAPKKADALPKKNAKASPALPAPVAAMALIPADQMLARENQMLRNLVADLMLREYERTHGG